MTEVLLFRKGLSAPNALSLLRVLLIPFIMFFLGMGNSYNMVAALLFAMAAFTDMADGLIARRFNSVTSLGKLLDPLADKLLVCLTLIMLVYLQRAPAWVVLIIVARELIITGIRAEKSKRGTTLPAKLPGKLKATVQYLAIFFLCLWDGAYAQIFQGIGKVLLYVALILTLYSGAIIFMDSLKNTEEIRP